MRSPTGIAGTRSTRRAGGPDRVEPELGVCVQARIGEVTGVVALREGAQRIGIGSGVHPGETQGQRALRRTQSCVSHAAKHFTHHFDQGQRPLITDAVINTIGFLARAQHAFFAQNCQMLRDVAL